MSTISFCFKICLFLCLISNPRLHGCSDILAGADNYYKLGKYDASITEYKRFLFLCRTDSPAISDVYYKIGECYKAGGQISQAIHHYNESLGFTASDSLFIARSLTIVTLNIARGNYSLAKQQLLKLSLMNKSPALTKDIELYLGVNSLYLFEWEYAKRSFSIYFADLPFTYVIDSLFNQIDQLPKKDPSLARKLSSVVPGLGQIYARDLRNGLNSIIINTIIISGLIQAISIRSYLYIGFNSVLLYHRLFNGNKDHAERAARIYNLSLDTKLAREILTRIQHEVTRQQEIK